MKMHQEEERKTQELKLEEERIAREMILIYLTLVVENWDRFCGVPNLFDESRFLVIRTKYSLTPCMFPYDFF